MKKLFLWLLCVLEVLILPNCSHMGNPFPDPKNTPPPGFFTLGNAVPGEYFSFPVFSADNQLIAVGGTDSVFSAGDDMIDELYVIDLKSNEPVYTFSKELIDSLALSPDGNQIAISGSARADDPNPSGVMFLLNVDSNTYSRITRGNVPVFSPDGRQLAFSYIVDRPIPDEPIHLQLKIRDLDTGQVKVVFENSTGGHILEIVWSPNGKLIAFVMASSRAYNPSDLYILNLENDSIQQLTINQYIFSINFSPDSNKILHMADLTPGEFGGNQHLFVRDLEGNCHQLPDSLLIDGTRSVTLSPDGSWIAFGTDYDGMQIAETEVALGSDFWETNSSC